MQVSTEDLRGSILADLMRLTTSIVRASEEQESDTLSEGKDSACYGAWL